LVSVLVWLITLLTVGGAVRDGNGFGIGAGVGLVTAGVTLGVLLNRAGRRR
jgi:hypothetical protein